MISIFCKKKGNIKVRPFNVAPLCSRCAARQRLLMFSHLNFTTPYGTYSSIHFSHMKTLSLRLSEAMLINH